MGRPEMSAGSSHLFRGLGWRTGASLAVLAAALVPAAAYAQDSAPASQDSTDQNADSAPDIIVTGTRQALQTSQNLKRNADTVVDTITATDIGAFPDKSVAESLQRV